jgi:hypothetical protein
VFVKIHMYMLRVAMATSLSESSQLKVLLSPVSLSVFERQERKFCRRESVRIRSTVWKPSVLTIYSLSLADHPPSILSPVWKDGFHFLVLYSSCFTLWVWSVDWRLNGPQIPPKCGAVEKIVCLGIRTSSRSRWLQEPEYSNPDVMTAEL